MVRNQIHFPSCTVQERSLAYDLAALVTGHAGIGCGAGICVGSRSFLMELVPGFSCSAGRVPVPIVSILYKVQRDMSKHFWAGCNFRHFAIFVCHLGTSGLCTV